jgi:cytochrome c-type biogenesis protein CcmF
MAYSIIILGGTSMPLLSQLFMARPTNVTASFYNNFSMPLGIIMLVLMVTATTMIVTKGNGILKKETIISFAGALILGIAINWGFTGSVPAYLYSVLAIFVMAQSIADMLKSKSAVILPSRLAHIGIGLLILGIITSNFHTTSVQKKLDYGTKASVDSMDITFSGVTEEKESRLRFTVQRGQRTDTIETAYYFHEKTQSIYKEPYIFAGFFNDIYIAPENYENGSDAVTNLIIGKGEEKKFSGVTVGFTGFRTEHMTSGEPSTYADIKVNGIPLSPGIVFSRGAMHSQDCPIPGTDRSVSLRDIDANSKKILLHITPGKNIAVPADSVLITVTRKRLIWLVWLGTICIACGGGYGLIRSLRSRT